MLWCAGLSAIAVALCHELIDRRGWPAWGRRFGVNAIAAYAGSQIMQVILSGLGWKAPLYQTLFAGWITPLAGPWVASLAWAVSFVFLWWLIVYALDRRGVYFRI